jgi:hypothetical protein
MKKQPEIDPELFRKLLTLKHPAPRNTERAKASRAAFLQEANSLLGSVTPAQPTRHNLWKQKYILHAFRKEHSPMINTLTTILLTLSLFLSGGAATVAAAQNSQPDQLLYGVKLFSENALLDVTTNPEAQFSLSLDYVDRRGAEVLQLIESGVTPSADLLSQYQSQIEQATRYAVNLPEDQAIQTLAMLQARLETQEQAMTQLQNNSTAQAVMEMAQVQTMLQERVQILEAGQSNLIQLRDQIRLQDQLSNPNVTATDNAGIETQVMPGIGNGNPWTTGTPTPVSSYGPGSGSEATCTPLAGSNAGGSDVNQSQGQYNGSSSSSPQSTMTPKGNGGKR